MRRSNPHLRLVVLFQLNKDLRQRWVEKDAIGERGDVSKGDIRLLSAAVFSDLRAAAHTPQPAMALAWTMGSSTATMLPAVATSLCPSWDQCSKTRRPASICEKAAARPHVCRACATAARPLTTAAYTSLKKPWRCKAWGRGVE